MKFTKYLALPREMTPFEHRYLTRLNKVALIFFYLHIPALMAVAWVAGTGLVSALLLSAVVMVGPTIAYRMIRHPRALSVVYGITAMLMGGLLVHFGQGPVQIEMHFYFFALLAMLCMFANPMVNIAAAVTVALHHLVVWLIIPASVFNYEAQWWVVLVHAAFVVLETIAACYISREFFDNVIGLEKIVEARTATIREKQRDMRLILDNVETGLVTVDLDGRLSSECSQVVEKWFGAPRAGDKLAAWLGQRDANFSEWFELALDSVRDGLLPPEVALGQLPKQLKDGDRTYAVNYQIITSADSAPEKPSLEQRAVPRSTTAAAAAADAVPEKLLVIVTDITERLRKEAAERYHAELLQLFQHIMRDKAGFIEFLAESEDLMRSLKGDSQGGRHDDLEHLKRLIHTLKGNAAIFGMRRLSDLCHDLENHIAEENRAPTEADMAALHQAWTQTRADLGKLIGEHLRSSIEIDDADYQAIIKAVLDGVERKVVVRLMESWRLEPAGRRLARIEQQIKGLAQRMGKGDVTVAIAPHDVRFNTERFAPFWAAFIHVLRNAVDHGIEDRELRAKHGKPAQSLIKVSTSVEQNRFVVTVEDDGPGVDWEALRAKAGQLGIDAAALGSKENLAFLPGVSSKKNVTELSGRGIGMAAVRDACEALGGKVEIRSQAGLGTRISFAFPVDQAVYEGHAATLREARKVAA
jgi:two-component system, chemotaxis family, sensor kinase CheA